jgi:hypothetical protein
MMFDNIELRSGRFYGVMVDPEDVPNEGDYISYEGQVLWGIEFFPDGLSQEKPMCELIITAANHACDPPGENYPGGLIGTKGRHYTWEGADPFEEPRIVKEA